MKEILAIIRLKQVNKTKEALAREGFPAVTCRKVLGRGKKKIDFSLVDQLITSEIADQPQLAEYVSEGHRLIPKRMLNIFVNDGDVKKVVNIIIETNSQGNPGDGKIFVLPVSDAIRVRDGQAGEEII